MKGLRINDLLNVGNKVLIVVYLLDENLELNVFGVDFLLDYDKEMLEILLEESG